jgi:DNA-binding PadR family transcriptional regulator
MRSSIAWALLGLVIERPSYGWELAHRFRRVYGETLSLSSPARIYEALDSLIARALIQEVNEPEPDSPARRPKPRYRANERGVEAYQDWLLVQLAEQRHRSQMFARQLALLEPRAALAVIERYEQECLTEGEPSTPAQSEREGVAERLAEEDEHLALEARLSWIRYARHELAALIEQSAGEAQQG